MALGIRCINRLALNYSAIPTVKFRHYASTIDNHNLIVTSDDGSVVVCWHPEKPFPYEMSLPIPEKVQAAETNLKVQSSKELKSVFKEKTEEEYRAELQKMTYTIHHQWFIKAKSWRRKQPVRFPRPYL